MLLHSSGCSKLIYRMVNVLGRGALMLLHPEATVVCFGQSKFGPVGSGSTRSDGRGEAAQGVGGVKTHFMFNVIKTSEDVA